MQFDSQGAQINPYTQPAIVPTSPLTRTEHPKDRFEEENTKLKNAIAEASQDHQPEAIFSHSTCEETNLAELSLDPYAKEPIRCILCPRRYAVDYIKPDYKNPKLLYILYTMSHCFIINVKIRRRFFKKFWH